MVNLRGIEDLLCATIGEYRDIPLRWAWTGGSRPEPVGDRYALIPALVGARWVLGVKDNRTEEWVATLCREEDFP